MSTDQTTGSKRRSLEDRLDSYAEAWRAEPGETLAGELVDVAFVDSDYGEPYPVLTIRRDDGTELAFHAFRTVARSEVKRARPQIGERVGVKYFGEIASKDGKKTFHKYRVAVDHSRHAIDYGEPEAEESEGEPAAPAIDDVIPF